MDLSLLHIALFYKLSLKIAVYDNLWRFSQIFLFSLFLLIDWEQDGVLWYYVLVFGLTSYFPVLCVNTISTRKCHCDTGSWLQWDSTFQALCWVRSAVIFSKNVFLFSEMLTLWEISVVNPQVFGLLKVCDSGWESWEELVLLFCWITG